MKNLSAIFVLLSALWLSGCSGWGPYVMQNISNKHDGSLIKSKEQASGVSKQDCHQWCHNGWCSTHCENRE